MCDAGTTQCEKTSSIKQTYTYFILYHGTLMTWWAGDLELRCSVDMVHTRSQGTVNSSLPRAASVQPDC